MGKKHLKSTEQKVVELYKKNVMRHDICRIAGVSEDYLDTIRKRHNLCRGKGRKSEIPADLFTVGTSQADYWLGYLISDGNISSKNNSRSYRISIATIDREIVDKFLRFCPKAHLFMQTEVLYIVYFSSVDILKELEKMGVTGNKSRTIKLKIPLNNHILRGVFDGDGSVHNKRPCIKITTGSPNFGKQIVAFLKQNNIYSKLRQRRSQPNCYDVWVERQGDYQKFYSLLYKGADPEIYMERKFNKFFSYKKYLKW